MKPTAPRAARWLMSAAPFALSAALTATVLAAQPATAAPQTPAACQDAPCPFTDATLSPEARAHDLIGRMTLDEKAQQLGHIAPAIPRLNVPEYNWWNEGLHGVARAGIATVFPQAIGMAASWDPDLMHTVGTTVSTEFRAKYAERVHANGGTDFYRGLTVWSPNINIFRDPRWGRGQETYGEDPFLTGRMGVAYITGLQGDDPTHPRVVATAKHFAVHSGPEEGRHQQDMKPSAHDLEDTYLPAFRAAVTEGQVQSVMCAYNALYDVPACASTELMQEHLRDDWGFKGYVVSDCGAAANIYRQDSLHYTKTAPEAVAVAFKAGMDLICGDYRNNMTTEPENIVAAVKSGLLSQDVVDRALERLFEARYRLGLMDPISASPYASITAADYNTPEHRATALKIAQESIVLLKNDNKLLPFNDAVKTIAVIGPNADSYDTLVGNYYGRPTAPVTVLDGLRTRFPDAKIIYAEGTGLIGQAQPPVPDNALCLDAKCTKQGLKAEWFTTHEPSGTPASTSLVTNATASWSAVDKDSSARFTGYLKAPQDGEYSFRYASENGYRIWIGDKLIVDEWGVGDAPSIASGKITLKAGTIYPIRVEAFQRDATGNQRLVWSTPANNGEDAVAAAKQADAVVFVGGLSARIEGEEMKVEAAGFAGGDRTSLDLPAPQQKLLERVSATGKPVVLVLMNGSALGINWAKANVPAIVEAWYPGGDGGTAVAGALAGDFSPAGRLPVTFYQSADQLPAFTDYSMTGRTYRYFKGAVLYPFGYGLSYTTFDYDAPALSAPAIKAGDAVTAQVKITNSGGRDSDEVVQLYVKKPGDSANPVLAGFQRVHLKAGESRTVSLALDARALSQVDDKGNRHVLPGRYDISLGGGQPAYAKTVSLPLTITGEIEVAP
ncbi:glycoside hydrolase family 3 protein [Asticcacaulis taihuensis]|uniref:glycoside hydrolase family 3 protein n=1 Tax=Asticcacaulis taihuensis TaxID=260084 RepID=UPI0026E993F8|nr:glycoside hydrolase family 3 protein [Asticcacaulis taihuensis]